MLKANKKILFRLDSSPEIGLGHFMRCKVLADSLMNFNCECYFAVINAHDISAFLPHTIIQLKNEEELAAAKKLEKFLLLLRAVCLSYCMTVLSVERTASYSNAIEKNQSVFNERGLLSYKCKKFL